MKLGAGLLAGPPSDGAAKGQSDHFFVAPSPEGSYHESMTDIILESISDGVFTVDDEWRITTFNRAAEWITGLKRGDVLGRVCHTVFRTNMCEEDCPLRRTIKTGKPVVAKRGYYTSPSGEHIPVSVSTALLIDDQGRHAGGAETFRDLREIEELKEKLQTSGGGDDFSSRSPAMRRILDLLPTIAGSASTVLIDGETGTGKEVTARTIHLLSDRAVGPFVAVNCGALPDTLLESELFGYRKGAFTGADRNKPGRFKLAEGGTLFLDEIGDISPALQVKLLRVLQEREYEALGSTVTEKTNARIICATNKNLSELVESGGFRQDLYYRINVIHVSLPPLRERPEDIPRLADRFLQKYKRQVRRNIAGFSGEAYAAFYGYSWPGNIRELENAVERAVVLCDGDYITLTHLPPELGARAPQTGRVAENGIVEVYRNAIPIQDSAKPKDAEGIRALRREMERRVISEALRKHRYKCSAAANELGIDKATLYRKIKSYGISLVRD